MDLGEKYYKQDLLNYIHLEYYCVQSNCSKAELIKRLSYQDFKYTEAISVNVTTNLTIIFTVTLFMIVIYLLLMIGHHFSIWHAEKRLLRIKIELCAPPSYDSIFPSGVDNHVSPV